MRTIQGPMVFGLVLLGLVACQPPASEAPAQKTESQADRDAKVAAANEATFEVYDFVRFENGKAVEHWGLDDSAMVLMPTPLAK